MASSDPVLCKPRSEGRSGRKSVSAFTLIELLVVIAILATNKWVFVALVVQPSQAILYLFNDGVMSTATNVNIHAAVAFNDITMVVSQLPR
jgi:prepilin-type N-terminal cleavage/methylation domain-containing protein